MKAMRDAALAYARRGWSIIPIRHKLGTDGKQPAVKSWKPYQSERPTDDELRVWFADGRALDGLAVILGAVSGGLVCRDFDILDGYTRWAAAHPELAGHLPTVETARGRHVYFTAPVARIVKVSDGELRGAGYCLLPPSRHPTGPVYRWLVPLPDGPLPEIDPAGAGFLPETERAEQAEKPENTEEIEETERESNTDGSNLSALSVSRAPTAGVDALVEAAIGDTLPKELGQRNIALFALARALKAIPALADAPVAELRSIVQRWHDRALAIIGTKQFDDTWADFLYGWARVRFPKGQEPMTLIVQRAGAGALPAVALKYDTPETRRLVAICRELQRISGTDPFFLSCRTCGALLGMDQATAWRRLGMLLADGVLELVRPGTTRRATRYRYIGGD